MMGRPLRRVAMGGIAFGIFLLAAGVFVFAWSQGWLPFVLNIWALCGIFIILVGIVVLGGVLWGRRMMRGGWRRWAEGWGEGEGWRREPPVQ